MTPQTSQRLLEVRQWALQLMAHYGLHNWSFAFNRRKRALGFCHFDTQLIELSIYFVEHNGPELLRDTLLHEIAHALVGAGHGHDLVWKRKCLEIGARPMRCCGHAEMPRGRWQAECGSCGYRYHRHRRPKRLQGWYCRVCGLEKGPLVWRCA